MPEAGYYEVHLAEALVKSGNKVRIFTSDRSNLNLAREKIYPVGLSYDSGQGYEIERLRHWFRVGSTILCGGLLPKVQEYDPEIVLAIGVAKMFPVPVLIKKSLRRFLLYTFFGENNEYYNWTDPSAKFRSGLKFLTRNVLKKYYYQLSIKNSDKIFTYTPETLPFLKRLVNDPNKEVLESKIVSTSLGFDSTVFYYNDPEREQTRREMGIGIQDFLIVTVTRYSKSKSLEFMVDNIIKLKSEGYRAKYWIIGFIDQESMRMFREYLKMRNADEFISCFPFTDYSTLRKYQAAADVGLWCQVTISIQQSMGTGLPVILEEKKSVSHLVTPGVNGLFFVKDQLGETLKEAVRKFTPELPADYEKMRRDIGKFNAERFSYNKLIKQIIDP
jgi:glycosyltransferase involved in cell wall biosynthesis